MIENEKLHICILCNYETTIKSNYTRHISSDKHNEKIFLNNDAIENYKYVCSCGKKYKGRDGLWRHQQKCENKLQYCDNDEDNINYNNEDENEDENDYNDDDNIENENDYNNEDNIDYNDDDINEHNLKEMIKTLVIQNQELQKTLVEESKEFRDTITNMQINASKSFQNINNNNNNTFNLNVFLNETCKDAMNIDDFIDSIQVTVEDIKHLGKAGYVEGMSKLLIKSLEELDITQRPLHCSDIKRETIYIRDKNLWTKESDQKVRLTKIAMDISRINTTVLQNEYQKMYPNCLTDYKSKEHEEYGKIAYEAFGGKLNIDKANKKLFRNIMKMVSISKSVIL